jgi:hypothetical protein
MRWGLAEQLQMWLASIIRTISPPSWTVRHSSSSHLAVGLTFTPPCHTAFLTLRSLPDELLVKVRSPPIQI